MINLSKPFLTSEEAQAASDVIMSGWVTQGPRVKEFEGLFAQYTGANHAVAVSSCTTALHLALLAAGVGPGDEVICPSLSFIATANSILHAGATPVFADVDKRTLNIDPHQIEELITENTKAIMIVHQVGLPADIDAFRLICDRHKLKLIEDAACAIGSAYKGKKIGAHSELVCFSFHPRKVITTGEGGMITTSKSEHAERLRKLRHHGMSVSDIIRHTSSKVIFEEYEELGYNYRMTDIQAAIGIKQLEKLDWLVSERRKLANYYHQELANVDCLELPVEDEGYFFNYQSYWIYLKDNAPVERDSLIEKLRDKGIATKRGIMTVHREPAFKKFNLKKALPASEDISDHSLLIPLYAGMTKEETLFVAQSIKKILK